MREVVDVTDFIGLDHIRGDSTDVQTVNRRLRELEAEMFQRARERQEANLRLRETNEAMAQLDRAKTTFFSNLSHELRTPLTLTLGPREDLLRRERHRRRGPGGALVRSSRSAALNTLQARQHHASRSSPPSRRAASRWPTSRPTCRMAHRRARRAFPRAPSNEPACELSIRLPAAARDDLGRPGHVGTGVPEPRAGMPIKYTLQGEIRVSLRRKGDSCIELAVQDTGVGIRRRPSCARHASERFRRVQGARGHERAEEAPASGLRSFRRWCGCTAGTIGKCRQRAGERGRHSSRPFRSTEEDLPHLPAEDRSEDRPHPADRTLAELWAEEAQGWLPRDPSSDPLLRAETGTLARCGREILVVDDNADMRAYMVRLLGLQYEVEAVADGDAALSAMGDRPPDLVLTDVTMVGMSGVDLVRRIRQDARNLALPVVVVSNGHRRDGGGSHRGHRGRRFGDYLIKPFNSARELLTRIG
ncbi:MAG: response regulator [Comamonadaceae bacterium]|nr:response regulator [Comamonadaceae bacterium]